MADRKDRAGVLGKQPEGSKRSFGIESAVGLHSPADRLTVQRLIDFGEIRFSWHDSPPRTASQAWAFYSEMFGTPEASRMEMGEPGV